MATPFVGQILVSLVFAEMELDLHSELHILHRNTVMYKRSGINIEMIIRREV